MKTEAFADWYVGLDYAVIPIRENTKNDYLMKWSQSQLRTKQDVKEWFSDPRHKRNNFALATGSRGNGLLVLDLDKGQKWLGDFGEAALERAEDVHRAYTVKTPSGGFHYYFKMPDFKVGNSAGLIAPDVDIRAEGGLIIAPPSIVKGVGQYKWVEDSLDVPPYELPEPPQWLIDELKKIEEERVKTKDPEKQAKQFAKKLLVSQGVLGQSIFEEFNSINDKDTLLSVFLAHGWTVAASLNDCYQLTRPGKKTGVSGVLFNDGFKNYSGNADPFSGQTKSNFSLFDCYCLLEHGGNIKEAASELKKTR